MDLEEEVGDLIHRVSGLAPLRIPKPAGVYPPYLAAKYDRETAARRLRAFLSKNEVVQAVLFRAALVDPEEDVRKTAMLGLFHARCTGLETILVASIFDVAAVIRRLALECLVDLGSPSKVIAAKILAADSDSDVAQLAADILAGHPVTFYELEGP